MEKIFLSEKQIKDINSRLGKEISEALKNEEKIPVMVGVMKGALPFFHDLVKEISIPIKLDYIQVSSYKPTEDGVMVSSGVIKLIKDITMDLTGRTVVIVEDIVDTGVSMSYLINYISSHFNPKRVLVCSLLDNVSSRKTDVKVDFAGLEYDTHEFVVGYGLDFNELGREKSYIFTLDEEGIKEYSELSKNK